jgi:hypothetical protein
MPIAAHLISGKASTVGLDQLRIERHPLRLERCAQHGVTNLEGVRFEHVQCGRSGEDGRSGLG